MVIIQLHIIYFVFYFAPVKKKSTAFVYVTHEASFTFYKISLIILFYLVMQNTRIRHATPNSGEWANRLRDV